MIAIGLMGLLLFLNFTMKEELTDQEKERLHDYIDFLNENQMTVENKDKYYDELGHLIILLDKTKYRTSDLKHTYRKEVEFFHEAKTDEERNSNLITAGLGLLAGQLQSANVFIKENY